MRISDWRSDVCSSDLVGSGSGISEPVVGLLAVQAGHQQRRYGLWRFQTACDVRSLGWLAGVTTYHPIVVGGWGCSWPNPVAGAARREQHAHPFRSLLGDRRLDRVALG